jgi:hypothetical protein
MTATLWLRIAAAISLVFTAGHTMGGLREWSPMGPNAVLDAMRGVHFQAMGANRSYFDFYMGFGWSISVTLLMQTVLLWQMASLARTDAPRLRPLIAVIAVATAANGVIAWRLLIPHPVVFSILLVAALAVAYVRAR